ELYPLTRPKAGIMQASRGAKRFRAAWAPSGRGARRRQRADVGRGGPDQASRPFLLGDVADPAGNAAGGEERREAFARDAERLEEQRGVELDVDVEPAVRLALGKDAERGALHRVGERYAVAGRGERAERPLQRLGAWVAD